MISGGYGPHQQDLDKILGVDLARKRKDLEHLRRVTAAREGFCGESDLGGRPAFHFVATSLQRPFDTTPPHPLLARDRAREGACRHIEISRYVDMSPSLPPRTAVRLS